MRPTETRCGMSSHVVACNQFSGPGLRTPTVWLGLGLRSTQGLGIRMNSSERLRFHRLVGLLAYPHVDTPTAGTRKHGRGVPKMLNPHVDAQTIDVWKHTQTITQMLPCRVDAERCVFPHSHATSRPPLVCKAYVGPSLWQFPSCRGLRSRFARDEGPFLVPPVSCCQYVCQAQKDVQSSLLSPMNLQVR